MDIDTKTFHDRSEWPPGAWDREPDYIHWVDEATGLDCLIARNSLGALCGYVGVDFGHPLYGTEYNDAPDALHEVHGGLTYSAACAGHVCHAQDGEGPHTWWLGFDCNHYGDRSVSDARYGRQGGEYRDVAYVRQECRMLARRVREATDAP